MTTWSISAIGSGRCTSSLDLTRDFARPSRRSEPAGMWVIRKVASHLAGESASHFLPPLGASTKLELQLYTSSKLQELRSLEVGWDGGHADSVSQGVTHQVYRILDQLADSRSVYPFLTPTSEGGVLAEWRAGKERLEIEFTPGEAPYVYAVNVDGELRIDGHLGEKGIAAEARRALKDLSLRVWTSNPAWKRLFV